MNPIFAYNRGLDYTYLYRTKSVQMSSIDKDSFFSTLQKVRPTDVSSMLSSYFDTKKVIEGIRPSEFPKAKFKSLSNSKSFSKALESTASSLMASDFSDKESLGKSVKGFITAYNNLIESSANTENLSILRREVFLTGRTLTYSSQLEKLGITIKKDNTLQLDEAKFEKADLGDFKEILGSRTGFAERVGRQAAVISRIAENQMNSINKTYNRKGTFYHFDYATRIYEAV